MAHSQPTVLVIQATEFQGQAWELALASQQVAVIRESPDADVILLLRQLQEAGIGLPDLLLLDMGISGLNPYAFCRLCRDAYPTLAIILTNNSQRQISDAERRWAVFQGAQGVVPGFQQETLLTDLMSGVEQVLQFLENKALDQQALIPVLSELSRVPERRSHSLSQKLVAKRPDPRLPTHAVANPKIQVEAKVIASAPKPAATPPEPTVPTPVRRYRGTVY